MPWLTLAAAAAAGYILRWARPARRVLGWAAWQLVGPPPTGIRWWAGCAVRATARLVRLPARLARRTTGNPS